MTPGELALLAGAGLAAGFVNAVAGGGTLISFPALTATGVPIVAANVTNTVALSPGYLGAAVAQRAALTGHGRAVRALVPAAMLGGLAGGVLLLVTSDALFQRIVPFMILAACALLAADDRIRAHVRRRRGLPEGTAPEAPAVGWPALAAVFGASVYGGYFGAGLGIILLAVLGALVHEDFRRVNAIKQVLSLAVNVTAAAFFVFSGRVAWSAAGVVALASLAGGQLGGRAAGHLPPRVLRAVVIVIGVAIAVVYLVR